MRVADMTREELLHAFSLGGPERLLPDPECAECCGDGGWDEGRMGRLDPDTEWVACRCTMPEGGV